MEQQRDTVLIAEDNADLRDIFRTALQHAGYHALEAEDGDQALALVESGEHAIDLVVADAVMPRMGGRELVWRLTEGHPHLPVIMISAILDPAAAGFGMDVRPRRFLPKPCAPEHLVRSVGDVLREARGA